MHGLEVGHVAVKTDALGDSGESRVLRKINSLAAREITGRKKGFEFAPNVAKGFLNKRPYIIC